MRRARSSLICERSVQCRCSPSRGAPAYTSRPAPDAEVQICGVAELPPAESSSSTLLPRREEPSAPAGCGGIPR